MKLFLLINGPIVDNSIEQKLIKKLPVKSEESKHFIQTETLSDDN